MTEEFAFNARQYFDFSKDQDDLHSDSYFDVNEERIPSKQNGCPNLSEDITENIRNELSDTESDCFFSPMGNTVSSSTIYLKGRLRKSLSMNNLPTDNPDHETKLSHDLDDLNIDKHKQPRASSSSSLNHKMRVPSQDSINRLAQPKRFTSQDHLDRCDEMTLAQAVIKFERGTPKRFRSKPSPKMNKAIPMPWGGTRAHSPKLMTTARVRPVSAISKEEQERREIEEAKKFKIKANPVNKKVMKGPLKPQIEKKPATVTEPFHLTEIKKKNVTPEEEKAPVFKAQPLPKSLQNPFKVQPNTQPPTKGLSPSFSRRLTKTTPNKVDSEKDRPTPQTFKPTRTQPMPFSFEQRDKQLMKKKEEFINRVLEEERKAREFHARPPPKAILRSRNSSQDIISDAGSIKSFKRSTEDLNTTTFKARPATVLMMKPFEPKRDENHVVKVEAFQFNTDQRVEARHKFEEKLKEREALAEAHKKQQEEMLKKLQEEEVAKLRKQMEHKAQPIKKYKQIEIQPANKVTEPISPKFHTDRIRNKENIQQ